MINSSRFVAFLAVTLGAALAPAQLSFTAEHYKSGDNQTLSIASGDFNNDGILDLVTINQNTLSFYKGTGGGGFAAPVSQKLPPNIGNRMVAADFNRDGKLDLALSSYANGPSQITILMGSGNGTFTPGTPIPTLGNGFYLATADFNGDHLPDLVATSCNTSHCATQVFLNQGNGTFKQSTSLTYGGGSGVVAGDFNADGHQDIAVLDGLELDMYLGNGNGTFQSPLLASENGGTDLAVGDFYDNRIQSLAVLTSVMDNGGNYTYYVSTARYSNGTISTSSSQLVSTSFFLSDIAAGDLNGDFKDDIVITGGGKFGSGALGYYMLGKGDGTFEDAVSLGRYGQAFENPFIRSVHRSSKHDIGAAWTNGYIVQGGGAYTWLNQNGATNCVPPNPNALSVHVCAPFNGQVVGKTFTFKASGNAFNGIAKRMELWIDGKKVGQNLEDQLRVTTSLSRGAHKASFVVIDTFDHHVSNTLSFTASY